MSNISFDTPVTVNVYDSRSISTFQNNAQSKCCIIDRKTNYLYVAAAFNFGIVIIWQSDNNGYSWSKLATTTASDYSGYTQRNAYYLNYLRQRKNEGAALQLINIEDSDYLLLITPIECYSAPVAAPIAGNTAAYCFIHKTTGAKTVRIPLWTGSGGDQAFPLMSGGNFISEANLDKIYTVYKNSNENLSVTELNTIPLLAANGDVYSAQPTNYANTQFGMTGIIARLDCCQTYKYIHIIGNTRNEQQITYCRYNKTTGAFDQQANLDISGYYAIDPSIEADGNANLMALYGLKQLAVATSGTVNSTLNQYVSPNYPAKNYGDNANQTYTITFPGNTISFSFSGLITDGPNDKLWFANSSDVQISKYYANLLYSDNSAGTPSSGWWYTPKYGNTAFETSGMYVADGIIKIRFTSTASLSSGYYLIDKYYWNNIGAGAASAPLKYKISTNGGLTWTSSGTVSIPPEVNLYTDANINSGTYNLSTVGLKDGGFICAATLASGNTVNVYFKHFPVSGSSYNTTQPWYKVNSYSGDIVGCQFFRYSDDNLIYKGNGQDIRIAYQIGSGTSQYGNDYVKSKIMQERLSNTIYNNTLSSGTNISINQDFYSVGLTGLITDKYISAFDKIGLTLQICKYVPAATAIGLGKSTFANPIEFNTKVIIDPLTYDFPTIAEGGTAEFDTIIERDIRKIFFKPNFFMNRDPILNEGGFLRRNIWTLWYMGNEYEISQIVPKLIKDQIAFYEANVYVIGPSNDPFTNLTLPSET